MSRTMNIRGLAQAHIAKNTVITPQQPLTAAGQRYFEDLVASRAKNDWSRADVLALTRIAMWLERSDILQKQLDAEGPVAVTERGTPIVNPKFQLVDTLERRIIMAIAKLSIHAQSTTSSKLENLAKRAKNAEAVAENAHDDLVG